jgi:hypothetical protein
MNKKGRKKADFQNRTSIELIEEGLHLLRKTPFRVHLNYLIGTIPFLLGFLYFWADMSQSGFAPDHCTEFALIVAILYIWMKTWQSIHASQLKETITQIPVQRSTGRILNLIRNQIIIQPTVFLLLPLSAVLTLPFAWTYSFYHNFSYYGDDSQSTVIDSTKRAWKQALLWPMQNHIVISILSLWTTLVFLNIVSVLFLIPHLIKMFIGVENIFTQSGLSFLFNTTFLGVSAALTYLCVNPVIKAVYVLRCFYGESIHSGEDLRTEINHFKLKPFAIIGLLAILTCLTSAKTYGSEETPTTHSIESSKLDHSISEEIKKPEYAWRFPKGQLLDDKNPADESFLTKFLSEVRDTMVKTWKSIAHYADDLLEWLKRQWRKLFKNKKQNEDFEPTHWEPTINLFFFLLLAVVACILGIVLWRFLKNRKKTITISATALPVIPDLNQDEVQADQLASDEWLILARSLLEKGELRLALRAFYLSLLAGLAQQEWIRIAKFKSNMDYQREVERRAHAYPAAIEAFRQNRTLFESAWYGMHAVDQSIFDEFISNYEKIKGQFPPSAHEVRS